MMSVRVYVCVCVGGGGGGACTCLTYMRTKHPNKIVKKISNV